MKQTLYIFSVLFLLGAGTANAQKFAHVDMQSILVDMPEKVTADKAIEQLVEDKRKELMDMKNYYDKKVQMYSDSVDKMKPAVKAMMEEEIQALGEKIQRLQMVGEQIVNEREQQEYFKLINLIKDAIKKVAKAQGITYVFDISQLQAYEGGTDVTNLVRKEMKLPEKKAEAPKTTPNNTPANTPKNPGGN